METLVSRKHGHMTTNQDHRFGIWIFFIFFFLARGGDPNCFLRVFCSRLGSIKEGCTYYRLASKHSLRMSLKMFAAQKRNPRV